VWGRAIRLREAFYRMFSALGRVAQVAPDDLAILNGALAEAHNRLRLGAPTPDSFAWIWTGADDALDRMLWPIARSAAELLTAPELARVRECAGHPCGWLFLDASRNHSRRWCSMAGCGNRAKAKRHYERAKAARATAAA
jgi:predicted RNA-binding Zn ribbon-like protein